MQLHCLPDMFEDVVIEAIGQGLDQCQRMHIHCEAMSGVCFNGELSLRFFSSPTQLEHLHLEFNGSTFQYSIANASCLSSSVQQVTCSTVCSIDVPAISAIFEDGWQMPCAQPHGPGKSQWTLARATR